MALNLKKRFQEWRIKRRFKEQPSERILIYTDKAGNKYYTVKAHNLPTERGMVAWVYINDSKYGLTTERLTYALEQIKLAINTRPADIDKIAAIRNTLETATTLYCEKEILLNLALTYTFMNDEPDAVLDHWTEAKKKAWALDKEAESFFLSFAYQFTEKYSQLPKLNVPQYLEEVKPIINQLYSILNLKKTGQNLSKESTK